MNLEKTERLITNREIIRLGKQSTKRRLSGNPTPFNTKGSAPREEQGDRDAQTQSPWEYANDEYF